MGCKSKKYLHIHDWNYWWGYYRCGKDWEPFHAAEFSLSEGGCNVPQNLRMQNYLQRRKCMTFEIHSNITNRSMTVAARAMRKVLRRKRTGLLCSVPAPATTPSIQV